MANGRFDMRCQVVTLVLALLLVLPGCAQPITVNGSHNPTMARAGFQSTAFAIFKDRPGPFYAEALGESLGEVLRERGIKGGTFLQIHPENDQQFLDRATQGLEGLIIIRPVGGVLEQGPFVPDRSYSQIHYEIGAISPVPGGFKIKWEGFVVIQSGWHKRVWRKRLRLMAETLVDRLAQDGVIVVP